MQKVKHPFNLSYSFYCIKSGNMSIFKAQSHIIGASNINPLYIT